MPWNVICCMVRELKNIFRPQGTGVSLSLNGTHLIFGIVSGNPFKLSLLLGGTLLPSFALHPICLENWELIKEELVVVSIPSAFPAGWDFHQCLSTTPNKDLSSVVKMVIHNSYFKVELWIYLHVFFLCLIGLMF